MEREKRLDGDDINTSLMQYFQPKGDGNEQGREVCHVSDGKSFAQVIEIESMSRRIYELETTEGLSQEQDMNGQRLQWSNPKDFQEAKMEQNHWKAVASQITKSGYDSVRACDGTWIEAWARAVGVSMKPYGLLYHNEWKVEPLEWDDNWGETADETAGLLVADESPRRQEQTKITPKGTGTRAGPGA